jgi:OpgC protein
MVKNGNARSVPPNCWAFTACLMGLTVTDNPGQQRILCSAPGTSPGNGPPQSATASRQSALERPPQDRPPAARHAGAGGMAMAASSRLAPPAIWTTMLRVFGTVGGMAAAASWFGRLAALRVPGIAQWTALAAPRPSSLRPVSIERDLRLDILRGLSLFFIFIDDIPNNVFSYGTVQVIAFAAEKMTHRPIPQPPCASRRRPPAVVARWFLWAGDDKAPSNLLRKGD